MRDLRPDLTSPDADLVAEPACCPGGACGPIFETPLLELAFNRLRDFVGNRRAPAVVAGRPHDPPATRPLHGLGSPVSTTPATEGCVP